MSVDLKNFTKNSAGDYVPVNVDLRDPLDFDKRRTMFFDAAFDAVQKTFPREERGYRFELDELSYEGPETLSSEKDREALLKNTFPARNLKGRLTMKNVETGEVVDSKKLTLMKVPVLTGRGTFISAGNDYTVVRQPRLIPGIYHRRKNNGVLSAQFNVKRGTGPGFYLDFDPESTLYKVSIAGSTIPLYSILSKMGYKDEQLQEAWGESVFEANKAKANVARDWAKFYGKLFRQELPEDPETSVQQVRDKLQELKFNRDAVQRTLPSLFKE
jgi:DNA-directed RNA polymerase beta subunit